ncbi:TPA: hypothetical protein N2F43_003682 [Salmonella enterica]|nr:hypothetical protein [Salmonella enterica]
MKRQIGPHPYKDEQNIYYAGFNSVVATSLSSFGWGWHNEAEIQVCDAFNPPQ